MKQITTRNVCLDDVPLIASDYIKHNEKVFDVGRDKAFGEYPYFWSVFLLDSLSAFNPQMTLAIIDEVIRRIRIDVGELLLHMHEVGPKTADEYTLNILSAGPLETALGLFGKAILDDFEKLLKANPVYLVMIFMLDKGDISDEVWKTLRRLSIKYMPEELKEPLNNTYVLDI